jgi:D-alanyl-D-alanine dipeptidase
MKHSILASFLLIPFATLMALPSNFREIQKSIPSIQLEIRYYHDTNFIGQPVDGYLAPKAILTKQAIKALTHVQKELNTFGLGLKVFDAYRPQKAVDHFVQWGLNLEDIKMKEEYYPNTEKKSLFKEGYIAKKSGHSRGSTVDLTLVNLETKEELDMGSSFDFFGQESWVKYPYISAQQRANRMLLQTIMLKHGFKALKEEWWHFTLRNEPYPHQYFNFDVQ